ncbi:uncharacterized protein [Oscarella lobularis]|uniref:uncharacterized protein n=1 Tax=Oscarella lobularis TaxID=121494 RepID=UPI003313659A
MAELGGTALALLRDVFDAIDTDRSGFIDSAELSRACERLSLKLDATEPLGKDERLDFPAYVSFIRKRLVTAFEAIDRDGSGAIDIAELRQTLSDVGLRREITEREVTAMFAQVDTNRDNRIDFGEFSDFFAHLPDPSLVSIARQWARGDGIDVGADFAPPPLPPASMPLWRFLLAGGMGGVASRTLTSPLERIKLLAQTQTISRDARIASTLSHLWKTEGVRGLFAGNGANVARVFPYAALVCLAYSNLCKMFPVDAVNNVYEPVWRMGSAATAGTFATLLTHPLDVVRARLTVVKDAKGIGRTLVALARHDGFRGLYKGLGPTLLSIAPFLAVQQSSYDYMKSRASHMGLNPSISLFASCGIVAGTLAQTIVYPLDVLRRRMQVNRDSSEKTTLQVARGIAARHGIRGFYPGLAATYAKVVPAAAVSLLVRDAFLGRLSTT